MSVTSGFFNSQNGDRRYSAEQMAALFDGIINNGVFANVGEAFAVKSNGGNNITVGVGRAWLNSSWIYNDALLPLTASESDILLDRYDAVVLEVNRSENIRLGSIKIVEGTPASNPTYPAMINTAEVHQYPLCYIYRKAESNEITQANITNRVGTSSLPYVTGILQVQDVDKIVAQWEAQWVEWFTNEQAELDAWTDNERAEFEDWFASIKDALSDDVATQLANRMLALETGDKPAGKALCDGEGNNIPSTYSKKNHSHTDYAPANHDHPEYAPSNHSHSDYAPTNHAHANYAPTSHKHAASDITDGTFTGRVKASTTQESVLSVEQVRNISAGTSPLTPGTSILFTGEIYVMYE